MSTTVQMPRPPAAVYAGILDVKSWWSRGVQGSTQRVGDEFVFEVPGVHWSRIRVDQLEPTRRIVWSVLDARLEFVAEKTEWNGSEITFDIAPTQDGSTLTFTHVGLLPSHECYDACSDAWRFYIGSSLRDLILTGIGAPSGNPAETRLLERG